MRQLATRYRDLDVYKRAFELQQVIFKATKSWPSEERYSLTDQIRRSSRSIGANLSEAWAKRRYPAHFLSKLTDADGEAQETCHWLDTAKACEYLAIEEHAKLLMQTETVSRQLGSMIANYKSFCHPPAH